MVMFEIEDSKNVNFTGNKTTGEELFKFKNVENISLKNNVTGWDGKALNIFARIKTFLFGKS